jgi:ribosome-associated protein
VILTGTSPTHLRALGKRVQEELATAGIKSSHLDGQKSTNWLVIDYGNVICHAMNAESRRYYDLERLWGDAPRVEWQN